TGLPNRGAVPTITLSRVLQNAIGRDAFHLSSLQSVSLVPHRPVTSSKCFVRLPPPHCWARAGTARFSRRPTLAKKLYVGNLPYGISSSDLERMFQEYGTVESAQVITDRDTGRSKGFGFV